MARTSYRKIMPLVLFTVIFSTNIFGGSGEKSNGKQLTQEQYIQWLQKIKGIEISTQSPQKQKKENSKTSFFSVDTSDLGKDLSY